MKLKEQVAVITGAATGIGRASARLFAREGAKVLIADIKDIEGEETARTIREMGGTALYSHTDVSSLSQVKKTINMARDSYGRLDIFFHNAGIAKAGEFDNITEREYDETMAVNLKAGFFGAQYAAKHMKETGGGCILFTSSALGLRPAVLSPIYSITKAGLVMLTRLLAVALAGDNIRVNAICPGPVSSTPLWRDFIQTIPNIETGEYEKIAIEKRPIKRFGSPEEMAFAALFLVSPEASYITGVALPVDGGSTAT